jgi:hypothetical protein
VRYLIESGKIKAAKVEGRWSMERENLPLTPGQERAQKVKEERAHRIAQETLGPAPDPPEKSERRFSLRDLRATGEVLEIHRALLGAAGGAHPAVAEFREAMMLLAGGFHEFHGREKAAS